jgi:hypothetical protein
MTIEIILYLIGIVLSLVFIILNVWRAYSHYSEDKPVNSEPFVFAVLTLAYFIKMPYLMDKPLAVMFYAVSAILSLIITILYTMAKYK